jgi:hypothetical protein
LIGMAHFSKIARGTFGQRSPEIGSRHVDAWRRTTVESIVVTVQ